MNVERPRSHNSACICAGCEALRHAPSRRTVNLDGRVNASPGPVEAAYIRNRWESLGGSFHGPNIETATITEAALFAAVRAGRIKL